MANFVYGLFCMHIRESLNIFHSMLYFVFVVVTLSIIVVFLDAFCVLHWLNTNAFHIKTTKTLVSSSHKIPISLNF